MKMHRNASGLRPSGGPVVVRRSMTSEPLTDRRTVRMLSGIG